MFTGVTDCFLTFARFPSTGKLTTFSTKSYRFLSSCLLFFGLFRFSCVLDLSTEGASDRAFRSSLVSSSEENSARTFSDSLAAFRRLFGFRAVWASKENLKPTDPTGEIYFISYRPRERIPYSNYYNFLADLEVEVQ